MILITPGALVLVTETSPHGLMPGDRIAINGDPNSARRIVAQSCNPLTFRALTIKRGSKGWRRHMRRMKRKMP